jgi:integrase
MLHLQNGCSCSNPSISPKNWNDKGASVTQDWYIQYYFHDPEYKEKYPRGKFCVIKNGVNYYKTLAERRCAIKTLLKNEIDMLVHDCYNPITGQSIAPVEIIYEIPPTTLFIPALKSAAAKLIIVQSSKDDLKSCLKYIFIGIKQLRLDGLEISQVKRRHIKMLLENFAITKKKWSAHTYNKYRAYLMMLFKYLIEVEATEVDPVYKISKQKIIRKIRITLTGPERVKVENHLQNNYPEFHRFMHIFFHSGGRLTELMQLRKVDVDLENQTYKSIIKKGGGSIEKKRTIKNIALPLWKELHNMAMDGDFIFSKGLVPGAKSIRTEQITRRWEEHVKIKLGIKADFYSLKHSNLDEIAMHLDLQSAAAMAGHTSTAMVISHYAQGEQARQHERLKAVGNAFV